MESVYKGNIISSASYDRLDVHKDSYIVVKDAFVEGIYEKLPERYEGMTVNDLGNDLIIPAFSDLHLHAPQYAQRGIGMDCLLFDWLNNYTFPQEACFRDEEYARVMYARLIRELLRQGTFHMSLFTTLHYEACDILFEMLEKAGLYAYTGITNMDRNCPDYYLDSTKDSLEKTERFIKEHLYSKKVRPILTPRFAPTCSRELMKGLGDLAKRYDLGVQTHLVESKAEAAWSQELYPECISDGEIYERYGLLEGSGPKIFAHVIFPTECEERMLKDCKGIAIHCPDSTSNVTAGIMPLAKMHDKGIRIALGSDIGGGHYPSVYREVARAVQISKMKEFYEDGQKRITMANAFYLGTAEGGSIFDRVGKLEKGYRFNALVIENMLDPEFERPLEDALERFCYIGDDRNIKYRFIDGRPVDPEKIYDSLL